MTLSKQLGASKPQACRTRTSASWPIIRTAGLITTRRWIATDDGVDDRAEGAGKGAGIGAGVGGTAGLLAGLGLLAIPGLGPVVAAGWLAATAVGAAAGAATGGIVGALTEAGVSTEDAHSYAEGVRRGGTLVSARVAEAERSRLETMLNESAINLRDRSAAWQKAGWKSFDTGSKPYGAEEVRKERALYGGGLR